MIKFLHPELFFLFIPFIIIVVWLIIIQKNSNNVINSLGNKEIIGYLFSQVRFNRVKYKNWLIVVALFFLIIASIGPQIGTRLTELKREGIDLLIILDTSKSMDATDVTPSRIEKAKYELTRLINNLKGDRVGLIVFSGSAHLHLPLTTDYSAAKLFLNSINTDIVQTPGTDLSGAINLALKQVEDENQKYKVIVVVSDGEDHEGEAIDLAERAKELDVLIYTIGVGTPGGGPIPIINDEGKRSSFKKDEKGLVVTTVLNEEILNEIAYITDAKYIRIENQTNALSQLNSELESMEKQEIKTQIYSQYENFL